MGVRLQPPKGTGAEDERRDAVTRAEPDAQSAIKYREQHHFEPIDQREQPLAIAGDSQPDDSLAESRGADRTQLPDDN